MDLALEGVDFGATKYDVQKAFEAVLHGPDLFDPEDPATKGRVPNFRVVLHPSDMGRLHNGKGVLTLPRRLGDNFMKWLFDDPVRKKQGIRVGGRKIRISRTKSWMSDENRRVFENALYIPADQEEMREQIMYELQERLRVAKVQFGTWYRPPAINGTAQNRIFSVEYEYDYANSSEAWVEVVYDHKVIKIELGSRFTEEACKFVIVKFTSINKIAVGREFGNPYVVFDMIFPPTLEQEIRRDQPREDDVWQNDTKERNRICALDGQHARVAPYSPHLRLVLFHTDDLRKFHRLCRIAQCQPVPVGMDNIEANSRAFFSLKELYSFNKWLRPMGWKNAFQLEALLRNGLLNTSDLVGELREPIDAVISDFGPLACEVLRLFYNALCVQTSMKPPEDCFKLGLRPSSESPAQCLKRVRDANPNVTALRLPVGCFACHHITFTPTRTILEGPYSTQSNRIIRRYQREDHPELLENFVRVDFRDEDRMSFRWDKDVDGGRFLQERVGHILKEGFKLGGKHFEFLAYSTSALRSHAVWFMSPFEDPAIANPKKRLVTSESIRQSIGDFREDELLRQPSKYAARLAQAFTATDPSVTLVKGQWEDMPDIITIMADGSKSVHTDGVGTISPELGDMIWSAMCEASSNFRANRVKPSAVRCFLHVNFHSALTMQKYQIRFLGYKGVVGVDHRLTGVLMRLRGSQRKFKSHDVTHAELEIARAFEYPNKAYLNRPLVMVLEDRGVDKEHFLELQQLAKRDILTARDGLDNFKMLLKHYNLGGKFHLAFIVESLSKLGLDFTDKGDKKALNSEIFRRLLRYSINSQLRDIKHRARIPVPDSYQLVGIADEGVQYIAEGENAQDVYVLPEGRIYACIQESPEDEPIYLKGNCSISRSPVVHPGDLQRVYAIGKPPEGKLCAFRHLKNVVVLPAQGPRSLASCLGGGDLDGDTFDIFINNPDLLPTGWCDAAAYPTVEPRSLPNGRTVVIKDICDFIVQYIDSDVLGLVGTRHLMIADQSKEGTYDPACMKLAALYSDAVDYAKHGNPTVTKLPRLLIRYKPDWHRAEVLDARSNDYYESKRALGHLYRDITLLSDDYDLDIPVHAPGPPMTDTISSALMPVVHSILAEDNQATVESDASLVQLASRLFERYSHEMRYIRLTHTLTDKPGAKLSEEEVILGVILSTCTQRQWREDRTYRMKLHTDTLVRNVRGDLHKPVLDEEPAVTRAGLRRAWVAWSWAQEHKDWESATSFGLLALGILLDCMKTLNALPESANVSSTLDSDSDDSEY